MVDICDVVPLGGLPAGVVDDCEELVLPLLGGVLGLGDRAEQLATDLEVDAELHLLHHLLTPPTGPAVHKPATEDKYQIMKKRNPPKTEVFVTDQTCRS